MYCFKCGTLNDDNNFRCIFCSEIIQPAPKYFPSSDESTAMKLILPVGRSPWAIAAGYAGLLSPMAIFAPFAILFGVLALQDIKKHPEKWGRGRAIFGIIMGTISIIFLIAMIAGQFIRRI